MKKSLKVVLITIVVIIGIIILDTLQARIFKNSPIISWKENLEEDSYVKRGLLIDTYYCVKEKDIVTVSWKLKNNKYTCPKEENSSEKDPFINCLMGQLGAYITSEILGPHEVALNELIDIDMNKVDYSLVEVTDNLGIYIIIKTSNNDIISKLEEYLAQEYTYYKASKAKDYNVYVYNHNFDSKDDDKILLEQSIDYCSNTK